MRRITRLTTLLPIPDRWAVALQYRLELGGWPNPDRPRKFTEHLCAAKVRADGPALARYVDKFEARKVAAAALGTQCLVPLIGVWERAADVPVGILPPCALKCTHASHAGLQLAGPLGDAWALHGGMQVCALKDVQKTLDKWLRRDWYYVARERPYHYVQPRIIAEKWINGAVNYKAMVFAPGRRTPSVFLQRHGMDEDGPIIDVFDDVGQIVDQATKAGFRASGDRWMDLNLAKRLSQAARAVAEQISPIQDYVRVDFLVSGEKIYFGEITFYDSAGLRGFSPDFYDDYFGYCIREGLKRYDGERKA